MTRDLISEALERLRGRLQAQEEPSPDLSLDERLRLVERELAAIYGRLSRLMVLVIAALLSEWAKSLA